MMGDEFNGIKEAAGWFTAALVGGSVGLMKLARFTASNNAGIEHAKADESLLRGLRVELERLGEQNGKLSTALNDLQLKITLLNTDVGTLRGENTRQAREITDLHKENETLRTQVMKLQTEVSILRRSSPK
jgi:chromosome segregation ATPase